MDLLYIKGRNLNGKWKCLWSVNLNDVVWVLVVVV